MRRRSISVVSGCLLAWTCGCGPRSAGDATASETGTGGGSTAAADDQGATGGGTASGDGSMDGFGSTGDESGASTAVPSESSGVESWPDCPDVYEGDLVIFDETDLESLASTGRIAGTLDILGYNGYDLGFLSCLHAVDGEVFIADNPNLVSLAGLENLQRIGPSNTRGYNLTVKNNDAMSSLEGLGDVAELAYLSVWGNDSLASIDLGHLRSLVGLNIGLCGFNFQEEYDNPLLEDLDGLAGLESLEKLDISSQSGLVSLARLHDLASAGGFAYHSTTINNNPNLPYGEVELLDNLGADLSSCGNLGEPESNVCYCDMPR